MLLFIYILFLFIYYYLLSYNNLRLNALGKEGRTDGEHTRVVRVCLHERYDLLHVAHFAVC